MKALTAIILMGLFMVSCEKNRDTNDMNGHQDSLNLETNTVPVPEDPELDSLNTDRTEVQGTNGSIPTRTPSTAEENN